jgi:hypothetical protein
MPALGDCAEEFSSAIFAECEFVCHDINFFFVLVLVLGPALTGVQSISVFLGGTLEKLLLFLGNF